MTGGTILFFVRSKKSMQKKTVLWPGRPLLLVSILRGLPECPIYTGLHGFALPTFRPGFVTHREHAHKLALR